MFTIVSLFPLLLVDFLDGSQLLLEFHSPVLEPDLYLPLSQTEGVSNLNATSASQIVVEVELLLQLQGLEPGVCLPSSSPWTAVRTFDNWIREVRERGTSAKQNQKNEERKKSLNLMMDNLPPQGKPWRDPLMNRSEMSQSVSSCLNVWSEMCKALLNTWSSARTEPVS